MLLYHMNMGYPLLSEHAKLKVSSKNVIPRDPRAAEDLDTWDQMLTPLPNFQEQCYYHEFEDHAACAKLYNPDVNVGLAIRWDEKEIPHLFERFYKGNKGNFGIGLSITRAAMEYMGGRVQARNRRPPCHGAEFRLMLPVEEAAGRKG